MKNNAAIYLRSSKDRHDVAIDAQRRDLANLANEKGLTIVTEYADIVESAKSEYRPNFQKLITDIRSPNRNWQTLLMIDHARLSRQPYVGHMFRHDCERRNIEVIFASMPDLDPISKIMLDNMMDAMAVVHSMMSKQKGLAGMAENVQRGYRAGGRAPKGYELKHIATGAVREGSDVTKSVLHPSKDSHGVSLYLKARAAGMSRAQASSESGLKLAQSSFVGIEWNALTYAGHTVWNVHNEKNPSGGYKGGVKRRPRSEWHIKRDTHKSLITDEEAEIILSALENSDQSKATSAGKRGASNYLLTGVLISPTDDTGWQGYQKKYYRARATKNANGKYVSMVELDEAVLNKLSTDMQSDSFVSALLAEIKQASMPSEDPTKPLRKELVIVESKITKAMECSLELKDPAPAMRLVDKLENQRKQLSNQIQDIEREASAQQALSNVTEKDIRKLLGGISMQINDSSRDRLKNLISTLVEKITLDPATLECQIHYKVAVDCSLSMASPRGFEPLLPP